MALWSVVLTKPAPLLLFAYGNPGRGDDALGPLLLEALEAEGWPQIECQTDMQLQVEHVTDLLGREAVLFIDADVSCQAPYVWQSLNAQHDGSYTSHAMTPAALLQAFQQVYGQTPPPAELVRIRGLSFELGDELSPQAASHLVAAIAQVKVWCQQRAPIP